MNLAQYLKTNRERRELGVCELAYLVGIDPAHISRIERGKASVHVYTLYLICKELRCSYRQAMLRLAKDMESGHLGPRARKERT